MARTETLTSVKAGITRLREKGGASKDSLFDLVNAYVTAAGTIENRPGTRLAYSLPPGTVGLAAFKGKLVVFSDTLVDAGPDFIVEVISHPNPPDEGASLVKIHHAEPIAGALYIVAEWSDGLVQHYWLDAQRQWTANTFYLAGQATAPTAANGLFYLPSRTSDPSPVWQSGVARTVGEYVEPTVYNGFRYVVDAVFGTNPKSGEIEPVWPTSPGATVTEDIDAPPPPPPASGQPPADGGAGGNPRYDRGTTLGVQLQ